jgi:hypothetical protein
MDDEWRRWIAENLLLGGAPADITAAMVDAGFAAEEAAAELQRAAFSPYVIGAQRLKNRLDKRNWVIDTRRRLERLGSGDIERRERLSGDEFLKEYYSAGRPVIITGMLDGWPALHRWNIDYLYERHADKTVEIQIGRHSNQHYELNKERHQQQMRFGDFLDWIRHVGSSNDKYLTAYNGAGNRHALADLMEDVPGVPEYLDPNSIDQGFLWIGPRGTITPFHHDLTNNLLAQVAGRKRFVIASSAEISGMYNHEHCFSAVDARNIDYQRFPEMRDVRLIDFVLERGELLFLPVGWWHFVEGLEFSISLSFINFRWNNDFTASYPKRMAF